MQKLIALLIAFSITAISFSQSASVKGVLKDSSENKNLLNTAVALLRSSDSVLIKFTRADKDGKFSITGLKEGKFILMVTHPYMGDFFDQVELKQNESIDLGNVFLTSKSKPS